MLGLGIQELLVILLIVVVLFGATRLPQLGKGVGEGIKNFKRGLKGDDSKAPLTEAPEEDNGA
ncbi:MAG: twin-arginine translocase TatA/TatE family subunit [bacterium]|nr:twin-arginine translocase TatA/TatE family subunit [bacterium]